MHPILFEIGPFTVYTYGAFVFLGFVAGLYFLKRLGGSVGIDPGKLETGAILGFVVGFLGAKLLYLITVLPEIIADPGLLLYSIRGGLVFYGAPLAVIPFVIWYVRRHQLPVWPTLDATAVALCLGHAVGRIGCFFAGCCHGRATESAFGVRFYSGLVPQGLRGLALHPTQLYEAGGLLILFVVLLWLFKRRSFDGQVFFCYLLAYAPFRFLIEQFRGDTVRGFVLEGISTSQFISILVFLVAFAGFLLRRRKSALSNQQHS